ncbi:hypothetical protein XENTR_v10003437 [Xenopus tropicalis]|nr:hypothetical protein XENTR_v10003437 [Xenopus tropicalis]
MRAVRLGNTRWRCSCVTSVVRCAVVWLSAVLLVSTRWRYCTRHSAAAGYRYERKRLLPNRRPLLCCYRYCATVQHPWCPLGVAVPRSFPPLAAEMGDLEAGETTVEKPEPPPAPPAEEPVLWSPEVEVCLFHAMLGHKPVGVNRHFHMICIRDKFSQNIGRQVSSRVIWEHLRSMYDMQALHESEILPFPNSEKNFILPEDLIQEVKEGKVTSEEELKEEVKEEVEIHGGSDEGGKYWAEELAICYSASQPRPLRSL